MDKLLIEIKELKKLMLLQKEVLTVIELSLYTGYTVDYIYKMVSLNQIPYSKPNGKKLFFSKVRIVEWLSSNKQLSEQELEEKAANYIQKKRFGK